MSKIKPGTKVPDFSLPMTGGGAWSLQDAAGKKLVIYFYPRDMTSGCTRESQDFRDLAAAFRKAGTRIVGVSRDSVASHDKFKKKHELPFILASDEGGKVTEDYGVWVEKSMYGRKYMGIDRSTFLIDKAGTVRGVWHKVKVPGHVAEVLKAAKAL